MAHSRNDIIREEVQAEIDNRSEPAVVDGVNRFVMGEDAISDLVMRHVDPLVEEIGGLKARLERAEALVNQQLGPCIGCVEAPEEYCPRHGRSYNDMAEHLEGVIKYWMEEAENAQGINAVPPDAPRPVHGPEDGPDKVEDGHLPGL